MLVAVVGALAVIVVLLLVLLLARSSAAAGPATLERLGELRGKLDALLAAQQDVPRALVAKGAEQTEILADVRERLGALGVVTARLERVGAAVTEVQQLLQVPRLRGALGEMWLEELLRQVLPRSAYAMQYGFRSGERVDAVVKLGERLVPVDAKFPLESCQRMLAANGAEAERERRAFERSLRARIDEIADKYIRPDEGTYEFALMYLPAENIYYEALLGPTDQGQSVFAYAMSRNVVPVSPHTFYAYLLVIVHGLKGLTVEQRAREIQAELGALGQAFDAFWGAFEKVGLHLTNAAKQFDESERHAGRLRERFERLTDTDETHPARGARGP